MSKAEELASKEWSDLGFCNNEQSNAFKLGYLKGYHQAEKDLELGWEDISKIISIDQQVCGVMGIANYTYNHQQAMEEVLKRFKEIKK